MRREAFDLRRRRAALASVAARVLAGAVFIVFSVGKFTRHDQYLEDFDSYGLPESSLLIYLVGLLELFGGLTLIAGFLTRLAALVLFCNMVGGLSPPAYRSAD